MAARLALQTRRIKIDSYLNDPANLMDNYYNAHGILMNQSWLINEKMAKKHGVADELLQQTRECWKTICLKSGENFEFPRYPRGGPGEDFVLYPSLPKGRPKRTMNPKDPETLALKDRLAVPAVKDDVVPLNSKILKELEIAKSKPKSITESTTTSKVFSDIGNEMADYHENLKKQTIVLLFNNIRYFTPIITILLFDTFMFMVLIVVLFIIIPYSVELLQVSVNLLLFINLVAIFCFYFLIWCNRLRRIYSLYHKILNYK